jgi:hypothetical protein
MLGQIFIFVINHQFGFSNISELKNHQVEFFEGNKSENNKTKERVLISIISLSSKTKSFDERTNEELKVK